MERSASGEESAAVWAHQSWRDMLFLHHAVEPSIVAEHLPSWLEPDLYDGRAWVTIIPFVIEAARPRFVPRVLGLSFLEINVRTYVRHGGEQGIWFFSLEASSMLAVAFARLAIGLPYRYARMQHTVTESGAVVLDSRRAMDAGASLHVKHTRGAPLADAVVGTLDHFLIERYVLFTEHAGFPVRERVRHRPYPLHEARVLELDDRLPAACGLGDLSSPVRVHGSAGVDVDFLPPDILVGSAGAVPALR